jgi:hypothetical protein
MLIKMATGDRQRFIIKGLESVLRIKAEHKKKFSWLINKHTQEIFGDDYNFIDCIFNKLNGDSNGLQNKKTVEIETDCYFGGDHRFIFEFDELQHFSEPKKIILENYHDSLDLGFDKMKYINLCNQFYDKALKKGQRGYRRPTKDFPFPNGRVYQRAYLDSFRDILPIKFGLKKTIRICEFEVSNITEWNKQTLKELEQIIREKLN